MEQYTENQYDDDLTVGTDEYDDSYYTDADDLFAFTPDDESPISRLKSLILSIDWEITDEILLQFNEELLDLRDIWASEKINLVYVQALEKISKYIYHNKADSHPNAIKLLLTLYHNLEKIVSSPDLSESEKNSILIDDVKRFEGLKKVIGGKIQRSDPPGLKKSEKVPTQTETNLPDGSEQLLGLKAVVLGIDWEITDKDLDDLRQEVVQLEELYAHSRPRLILLQGIGTLGAYIKLKKSDAHADAFKVLHLFYESLEKLVATPMSLEEEKEILFPAVERFNSFKALLGSTITPEAISRNVEEGEDADGGAIQDGSQEMAPALSDFADEDSIGFQADEEAKDLGIQSFDNVDDHVEGFFTDTVLEDEGKIQTTSKQFSPDDMFPEVEQSKDDVASDREVALQGVAVGEDEEDALTAGSQIASPAVDLAATEWPVKDKARKDEADQIIDKGVVGALSGEEENLGTDLEEHITQPDDAVEGEDLISGDGRFGGAIDGLAEGEQDNIDTTAEEILPGIDVDSEADDDSEEDPLPVAGGDLAPALSLVDDESDTLGGDPEDPYRAIEQTEDEILDRVNGFFDKPEVDGLKTGSQVVAPVVEPSEGSPEEDFASKDEVDQSIDNGESSLGDAIIDLTEGGQDNTAITPEEALPGIDVDSEADDDSGEEPLPVDEGDLAPALSLVEDESVALDVDLADSYGTGEQTEDEVFERVNGFFNKSEEETVPSWAQESAGGGGEEQQDLDLPVEEQQVEVEDDTAVLPEFESIDIDEAASEIDLEDDVFMSVEADGEAADFISFIDEELSSEEPQEDDAELFSVGSEPLFDKTDDNLELEEKLDALFTDSLETETIESDPVQEEMQGSADVLIAENEAADVSDVPVVESDDDGKEADVPIEPPIITKVTAIPPFRLATPHVQSLKLVPDEQIVEEQQDEFIDQVVDAVDAKDEISESVVLGDANFHVATEDDAEEEVIFELVEELDSEVDADIDLAPEEDPVADITPFDGNNDSLFLDQGVMASDLNSQDSLTNLKVCIDSLGIEIEDKVIQGLYGAIHQLRQRWVAKPLEKTFLQLLSTVTQHIDKYRFESSESTFGLLESIYDALGPNYQTDSQANQERLLIETQKILYWQQEMLERQSQTREGKHTFVSPVRTMNNETDDAQREFDLAFHELEGKYSEKASDTGENSTEPFMSSMQDNDVYSSDKGGDGSRSESIKIEIDNLRDTLRNEIAELKKGMGEDKE